MTLFGGFQLEIERGSSKNMTFVFSNIVSVKHLRKGKKLTEELKKTCRRLLRGKAVLKRRENFHHLRVLDKNKNTNGKIKGINLYFFTRYSQYIIFFV